MYSNGTILVVRCAWENGGKLVLQIAYFCRHGQRHGRVSQSCAHTVMLHGRVPPGVPFWIKSLYPTGLTRPRHMPMSTGRVWHTGWHMGVWSVVWHKSITSSVFPRTWHMGVSSVVWYKSVCMPYFHTACDTGVSGSYVRHMTSSHERVTLIWLKFSKFPKFSYVIDLVSNHF